MTIDSRIPTMPGRSTSNFHQPGRHCLHQAPKHREVFGSRGRGGQEGAEQEGRGRTPCAFAGTTCPLAGAAGEGGIAATTHSTGSAIRQGRPRGGQGGEKRGVSSQTPRSVGLRNAPVPGSVSPALFHGENQLSRGKSSAVHSRTSEAQSGQPPLRQEEKRSYSSSFAQSFHSSRQNPHASEQQVRSTPRNRIFR